MEQRRLIAHGKSSLTLSMPKKWLEQRRLKKGDSLFIDEEGSKLIISSNEPLDISRKTVDLTGLDRTSIILQIMSLYRFGYNEIEILFENSSTRYFRKKKNVSVSSVVHKIVDRCIGMEVVEEGKGRILVKHITKEDQEDFKVILRRIFLLLNQTADNLFEGIKTNDYALIATTEDMHDSINKFVSYCLRLLNKYGYPDVRKTCFYYHIIASIDKIVDILKYNARNIVDSKQKFSPKTKLIWSDINKSIRMYYELFYKYNNERINGISENRDRTKQKIKQNLKAIPNKELHYLISMKQILEILLDLTDFRMGLEN